MPENEARSFLEEGNRLLGESRYEEALTAYDRAIAVDPEDDEVWNRRGDALRGLGRDQEAGDSYTEAVSVAPYLMGHGTPDEYDRELEKNPGDANAWYERGDALSRLRRFKEAVESYDRSLAIDPDNDQTWFMRAVVLSRLGRFQEAVESYERAQAVAPPEGYTLGSEFAFQRKLLTLTKAERWLKRYCPLNPYVELYSLVGPSEKMLHIFVRQRLQATFGKEETEWWVKGVPEGIRDKCAQRREHDPIRRPLYAQTDFTDLIAILAKRWSLFEHDFKRVKGQYKSSKDFLDDMARLVEIRHVVSHPVRGVPTEEDLIFARQMRETIEKFCGYERTCDTATEDLTT